MLQNRQLVAIMFTDIVSYTSIMGKDELLALDLIEKNRKLQIPIIKKHGWEPGSLIWKLQKIIAAQL